MSGAPWIKFCPSDWIKGTVELSNGERGVYIDLLALIYDRGEPVKRDDASLARRCNLTVPTFTRILNSLVRQEEIVETAAGFLTNERAEKVLRERENKSVATSKSVSSRWEKEKKNQHSENTNVTGRSYEPYNTRAGEKISDTRYQNSSSSCHSEEEAGAHAPLTSPPSLGAFQFSEPLTASPTLSKTRASRKASAAGKIPLPDDWTPSEDLFQHGESLGLTRAEVSQKLEALRYWASENAHVDKGRKKDWLRFFKLRLTEDGPKIIANRPRAGPVPLSFFSPQRQFNPLDAGRQIIAEILDREAYDHQLDLSASDRTESRAASPLRLAK
jgi:uncharacterized protein YdaU (DUF1376 family)